MEIEISAGVVAQKNSNRTGPADLAAAAPSYVKSSAGRCHRSGQTAGTTDRGAGFDHQQIDARTDPATAREGARTHNAASTTDTANYPYRPCPLPRRQNNNPSAPQSESRPGRQAPTKQRRQTPTQHQHLRWPNADKPRRTICTTTAELQHARIAGIMKLYPPSQYLQEESWLHDDLIVKYGGEFSLPVDSTCPPMEESRRIHLRLPCCHFGGKYLQHHRGRRIRP